MIKKENENKKITTEYIQFSKRVTRWGIILVTITLFICFALITFFGLDAHRVTTIGQLYTTYITIMGITIGAYQGNSSLEKWANAHYNLEKTISDATKRKEELPQIEEEEDTAIIEEDL